MDTRQVRSYTEAAMMVAGIVLATAAVGRDAPEVSTKYGIVQGFYANSAAIFLGMPYASPPVGPLRWRKPHAPKKWGSTVYNATFNRPACPQLCSAPPNICPKETAEDCLYLNIFIPSGSSSNGTNGWPVMIFIHGGNFFSMAASSPLFDGRWLASSKNIIVVTINYRIGALGFLVTGKNISDAGGNYGVLDQQQALKWVAENIHNFGGDSSKVTLFGQSAGAQSILIHMTLPSSAPYFRNAIVQSSPIAVPYKSFPEAIFLGGLFSELAGCKPRDLNCLRSKTATEIIQAQYQAGSKVSSFKLLEFFEPWGPFVDGSLIIEEPLSLIQSGRFSRKPLIIGTTSEETVYYIYGTWSSPVSCLMSGGLALALNPRHVIEILQMYPPNCLMDDRDKISEMSTDLVFTCPARNAVRIMRSLGLQVLWMYVWDHAFSFPGWGPISFCQNRVCHGVELVYIFQTETFYNFSFTPAEKELSSQIVGFWTNFAKTGNPNNSGEGRLSPLDAAGRFQPKLKWPVYSAEGKWPLYRFQTPESSIDINYRGPYCDFWDTVGYAA